jgi:hypothetical protein
MAEPVFHRINPSGCTGAMNALGERPKMIGEWFIKKSWNGCQEGERKDLTPCQGMDHRRPNDFSVTSGLTAPQ